VRRTSTVKAEPISLNKRGLVRTPGLGSAGWHGHGRSVITVCTGSMMAVSLMGESVLLTVPFELLGDVAQFGVRHGDQRGGGDPPSRPTSTGY